VKVSRAFYKITTNNKDSIADFINNSKNLKNSVINLNKNNINLKIIIKSIKSSLKSNNKDKNNNDSTIKYFIKREKSIIKLLYQQYICVLKTEKTFRYIFITDYKLY
jgi:hypothetical protein